MSREEVLKHCETLEICRQRPGRMLSVVDLIERGTLSLPLASLCLEVISSGGSFMVGARPGGAGKTSVMVALANFLPPGMPIVITDSLTKLTPHLYRKPVCFLCPEIGPGGYYGYLWGEKLITFFSLKNFGHLLVSNLHADTLQEVREQICLLHGVPEVLWEAVELHLFLKWKENGKRVVESVWWRTGNGRIQEILKNGMVVADLPVEKQKIARHSEFLSKLVESGKRSLLEVRSAVLQYLQS